MLAVPVKREELRERRAKSMEALRRRLQGSRRRNEDVINNLLYCVEKKTSFSL